MYQVWSRQGLVVVDEGVVNQSRVTGKECIFHSLKILLLPIFAMYVILMHVHFCVYVPIPSKWWQTLVE